MTKNASGIVINTQIAKRQSKKASKIQVIVAEITFAISDDMVLLSIDSILLQSDIIFVVNSDKSKNQDSTINQFHQNNWSI